MEQTTPFNRLDSAIEKPEYVEKRDYVEKPEYYVPSTLRRFFALMVDRMTIPFFFLPLWLHHSFSFGEASSPGFHWTATEWITQWKLIGSLFALQFSYRVTFLKFLGGTLGKLLLGLRVVSRNFDELSLAQCIIRVLTEHLYFFLGDSFRILALFRFDRTHLADWLAETRVVQMTPRKKLPERHVMIGLLLTVTLLLSGLSSSYSTLQKIKFDLTGTKFEQ